MSSNSLSLSIILTPKLHYPSLQLHSLPLPSLPFSSKKSPSNILHKTTPLTLKVNNNQTWKIHAVSDDTTIASTQDIIQSSTTDTDVSTTVISVLLFLAFVGLSILTIGVIYLAVTDFLQKRERDKFEKEEAAKKKKGGKKKKVRARAGPRGFGQKVEEDDFADYDD